MTELVFCFVLAVKRANTEETEEDDAEDEEEEAGE